MIFIYNFFLILMAILFFGIVLIAFLVKPKLRAGFNQKIGRYKKFKKTDNNKQTILIHAVSVGEVNAVENFIKEIRKNNPNIELVLTTTTKTGRQVAQTKLSSTVDKIVYFPYDFSFSVKNFLNSIQPDKIIIAETEIWPNFTNIAKSKNIPIYIINGRISPSSFNGYKKISFFIKNVLNNYTKILMQTDGDADRIKEIGAFSNKVVVMGNLKFDISRTLSEEDVINLKNELKLTDDPVFVAASTHTGEDEIVLNVYEKAKKIIPNLKLLIAPRHPQRFGQVENLLKKTEYTYGKRSQKDNFASNDVIMLDTMGELGKMFSIGMVAFIGGSFSNTGGHNPLEANIWGLPVISGPTVFNFTDIYKVLTQNGGAKIVQDENEFSELLIKFLTDKAFYNQSVSNIQHIFKISRGALNKALEEIGL